VKVFDGFEDEINIPNAHLTIGTFDGVHIGHQKIISHLIHLASQSQGESVLFTFDPHPRMILNPSEPLALIQTREEKLQKLSRLGLKNVILFPFSLAFSATPAETFIREFLVEKIKMRAVVIGYDHQFGRNREGSLEHFKKLSATMKFSVDEIPAQDIDDIHVSSTKIRNALNEGRIEVANQYLGEPFQLNGKVINGRAIGRTISFPTANIDLNSPSKIIPKQGVYLVRCQMLDTMRFGMMNIGSRPTIEGNIAQNISIEIHIFDFEMNIYKHDLQIEILQYIREERYFEHIDELKGQLKSDEIICRNRSNQFSLQPYSL